MKVGRDAFDEEAIRLIEENNPDVEFDWVRILKGPPQPDQRAFERSPEPTPSRSRDKVQAQGSSSVARAEEKPTILESGTPEEAPAFDGEPVQAPLATSVAESDLDELDVDVALGEGDPSGIQDAMEEPSAPVAADEACPTAAHRRLGSEGVSRLRARHAEIMARISERVADQVRQDELKSAAERLNPDTWVTDEEVRAGLEQYETVFESLRSALGRRRRRRRGGRVPDRAKAAGQAGSADLPDASNRPQERTADTDRDEDGSDGT